MSLNLGRNDGYTHHQKYAGGGTVLSEATFALEKNINGTILTQALLTPAASAATTSINYHKLFGVGDVTGTTAFGFGDPTKPTTGAMFCFGRTAIATATITDTALDARAINKLVNTGANTLQGAYIKAKNYSTGTVGGDLIGLYIETVNDGTVSGSTYALKLGKDSGTLTADILFSGGATLATASTSGTTLTKVLLLPGASAATTSINFHKLVGIGDITGTTAYGMGDPTKPTVGLMASFGRTALATGTFTDTGLDVRVINKLVDNTGAHAMQAAYFKAKNYSTGTLTGALYGIYIECVADGTVSGDSAPIRLGSDGTSVNFLIDASTVVLKEYDSGTKVVLFKFQDAAGTVQYVVHDTDSGSALAVTSSAPT